MFRLFGYKETPNTRGTPLSVTSLIVCLVSLTWIVLTILTSHVPKTLEFLSSEITQLPPVPPKGLFYSLDSRLPIHLQLIHLSPSLSQDPSPLSYTFPGHRPSFTSHRLRFNGYCLSQSFGTIPETKNGIFVTSKSVSKSLLSEEISVTSILFRVTSSALLLPNTHVYFQSPEQMRFVSPLKFFSSFRPFLLIRGE